MMILLAISLLHVALSLHGSAVHSPAWDEVGHLAAGLEHWELGTFELYKVNPPLPRAVAAIPVLLTTHPRVAIPQPSSFPYRAEWEAGADLIRRSGPGYFQHLTHARWMLLPFSLLGMLVCVRWAWALGGPVAGLCAALIWGVEPNLLAATQLITPDLCASTLGIWLCWRFRLWLLRPTWPAALLAGFALGLCLLCKTTWLLAPVMLLPAWVVWRVSERNASTIWREAGQLLLAGTLALLVVNAGYGFSGSFRPLRKFTFFSSTLRGGSGTVAGYPAGNRFRDTFWGRLPVPLPASFVEGVDFQRSEFERGYPSYLLGEHRHGGWWHFYLLVLLWKVPLGFQLLLATGLGVLLLRPGWPRRESLLLLLPPLILLLVVSSQRGFNHHLRYVLPAFPYLVVFAALGAGAAIGTLRACLSRGQLANQRDKDSDASHPATVGFARRWLGVAALGMLAWGALASLSAHPHQLSYFNELAGGPDRGYLLAGLSAMDSLHDWQQDTLLLRDWVQRHPDRPVDGVALRGFPDLTAAAGLTSRTPPAGLSASERVNRLRNPCDVGPLPGRYALSIKDVLLPGTPYTYFSRLTPVERVGHTIHIYEVSLADAERVWQELQPEASPRDCGPFGPRP